MKRLHKIHAVAVILTTSALTMVTPPAAAEEKLALALSNDPWQYNLLLNPSPGALERERKGHVNIYAGVTDVTVEKALDEHFGRIQNMMFIKTVKTDKQGQPMRDSSTGDLVFEDDDC